MYKQVQTLKKNIKKRISNFLEFLFLSFKIGMLIVILFFTGLFFMSKPLNLIQNYKAKTLEQEQFVPDLSQEEFIELIEPSAREVADSHNIRPSLLIAQAALESDWGDSTLAKKSNNYFGIKDSSGAVYSTKEFENNNEEIEIQAGFKEYDSVYDSILDYANLLSDGTSWDEDLYQGVIQASNYKEAAEALQDAGYATDPAYADKVIKIIEQYQLYNLDE